MLQHEGLFPSPVSRAAAPPAPREPGPALRALSRLRWFSLDGRLAAGEDPARSRLLAAQARRLTAPRHRERLAAALDGMLLAAADAPRISRVAPSRDALLRNEPAVRDLARRVDSREALYARGLAHLERLLSDSTGPVFRGGDAELSAELERVEGELSGRPAPQPAQQAGPRFSRPRSLRRLARPRGRRGRGQMADPPGFAGGSFALPDGSWFHGRRESA
jgi:hypothetical protein